MVFQHFGLFPWKTVRANVEYGAQKPPAPSRVDAAVVLRQSGDRGSSRAHGRSTLVVCEIALTLVLLVGAGLLANSFLRLPPGPRAYQSGILYTPKDVPQLG